VRSDIHEHPSTRKIPLRKPAPEAGNAGAPQEADIDIPHATKTPGIDGMHGQQIAVVRIDPWNGKLNSCCFGSLDSCIAERDDLYIGQLLESGKMPLGRNSASADNPDTKRKRHTSTHLSMMS
jgi:hypothetical protein